MDCIDPLGQGVYTFSFSNSNQFGRNISAVTKCPKTFKDPLIRKSCESSEIEFYSQPFYRLPVSGRKSRVLYRNYYCAVCNTELDVVFWKVRVEIPEITYRQLTNNSSSDVSAVSSFYRATNGTNDSVVFNFVSPNDYTPRFCMNVVRKCAENWKDKATRVKCEDTMQPPVYVYQPSQSNSHQKQAGEGSVYKNIYCATCNYAKKLKIKIWCPLEFRYNLGLHGKLIPTHNGTESTRLLPDSLSTFIVPYSVLFDLNSVTMTVYEGKGGQSMSVSTINLLRECEQGTVYDPFSEMCRRVFCIAGSNVEFQSCTEVNATNELHSLTENLNCTRNLMMQINASEFVILSNGSAFMPDKRSIYDKNQYIAQSGYIYICAANTDRFYNETVEIWLFQFDSVQSILSIIGSIISLTFLFVQIVIYLMFPVLRNVPGRCIMCLAASIFTAQLLFFFVAHQGPTCFYLAAAMHFSFLASFCWMNVLSVDIWRTFRSGVIFSEARSRCNHFAKYSLYAWMLPAAITGVCLFLDVAEIDVHFRPHYGRTICWITNQSAFVFFILAPIAIALTANFTFFGITVCLFRRSSRESQLVVKKVSHKTRLILYAKLSIIMGLTWVLGFIANLTKSTALWYLFIIFNTMQGTFLCISFVCTKKVLRLLRATFWERSSVSMRYSNRT